LTEAQRQQLVQSFHDIDFTYNGETFEPNIVRGDERWELEFPAIIINFGKTAVNADTFLGGYLYQYPATSWKRPYGSYGATEWEECSVIVYAKHTTNGTHGMIVADFLMNVIRRKILTTWRKLVRGFHGKLEQENGLHVENITHVIMWDGVYGYKITFDIKTVVTWNTIPDGEESTDAPLTTVANFIEDGVDGI